MLEGNLVAKCSYFPILKGDAEGYSGCQMLFADPKWCCFQVMLEGIRVAMKLGNSKAMKKFGAKFYDSPIKFCKAVSL